MTMPRVLFVDDDELVLTALRRRMKRHLEWDMVFVTSANAALEELERAPFDVVVTDMRMPGLSGADLLERVTQRYPAMGRIGLTGYYDEVDLVSRGIAHVVLNKPCDNAELKSTISNLIPAR
jgi:DNA-binding NtrC family response regulator